VYGLKLLGNLYSSRLYCCSLSVVESLLLVWLVQVAFLSFFIGASVFSTILSYEPILVSLRIMFSLVVSSFSLFLRFSSCFLQLVYRFLILLSQCCTSFETFDTLQLFGLSFHVLWPPNFLVDQTSLYRWASCLLTFLGKSCLLGVAPCLSEQKFCMASYTWSS
jgi:hypothetical protein